MKKIVGETWERGGEMKKIVGETWERGGENDRRISGRTDISTGISSLFECAI
jgi:hypothetical protein